MARNTGFYKGRRKRRNRVLVPTAVVLALISLVIVLFYGMQKYAVITKEDVRVELPILGENGTLATVEDEPAAALETTEVNIRFEAPDFSGVKAVAGADVSPIRAIFIGADDFNVDKINECADRLNVGNALLIELKPRSGVLKWDSKAWSAVNFGLAGNPFSDEMKQTFLNLKEKGVYLAAQISCCRDELYASRSTVVTLRNSAGGNYTDEGGTWLDAYSMDVRNYTVQLARELYDLGFDEVVLADVAHPVLPEDTTVTYTRDMSTPPSTVGAVCGFAISVAEELADREGRLSIYLDSPRALVGLDSATGQDGPLFLRVYDRVYYNTDRYAYTFNIEDIRGKVTIGEADSRFVPVVQNYLPDNSDKISWVLVDVDVD